MFTKQTKKPQKSKQKTKPLKLTTLSRHDNNLILLKKNDECAGDNILLGPLGRTWNEELERKKNKMDSFMKEVEIMKERNRRALVSQKEFLNEANYDYEAIVRDREIEYSEYQKSKELPPNNTNKPVYICRRTLRYLNQPLPEFPKTPTNDWIVHREILNKFVEAARSVLIHRRLLTRLSILKTLTDDDIKFCELGGIRRSK
ncbi:hypothetical protein J6590_086545 [Homalodisca vitripennis]|nr:hypothetical protein J6590_086545 [Homalodisca vitripennis]